MSNYIITAFMIDALIWGYVVGMALFVYEPVRRLRQWPRNRRVRKENESYAPSPLDERYVRAIRELAHASLSGADLRGATLINADLRKVV